MHIILTELTTDLIVPARNITTQFQAPFSIQQAILCTERQTEIERAENATITQQYLIF
jgi:hypothetical protein